jgi:TatD DNase family protein
LLIDIHTHSISASGKKSIQNLYKDFQSIAMGRFYSIGIHPWYIDENFESQIENLISYANHVSVLAIGETGLDKICKTDFKLQQQIFPDKYNWQMNCECHDHSLCKSMGRSIFAA